MPFITQGKSNLKYILIVVILAVIVGGGILGYYYSWIREIEVKLTELETRLPEVKPPEEVIKDETADWNLYDKYPFFSLRYPPEWIVEDKLDEVNIRTHTAGPNSFLEISNSTIPEQPRLVFHVNPDGFGPFVPEVTYLLEATEENGVRIVREKRT